MTVIAFVITSRSSWNSVVYTSAVFICSNVAFCVCVCYLSELNVTKLGVLFVCSLCAAVFKGDIVRLCERSQPEGPRASGAHWRSLILVVPVRLGGEALNPAYIDCVKVSYQIVTDAYNTLSMCIC